MGDRVFGPIQSRRLGYSLGIDVIPFKTCSLDCIYCECGKTTKLEVKPQEFYNNNKILDDIHNAIKDIAQINFHPDVKKRLRGLQSLDEHQIKILESYLIFLETKRYAKNTIELYLSMVKSLFLFMKERNDTHDICNEDIENYTYEVIVKRKSEVNYILIRSGNTR